MDHHLSLALSLSLSQLSIPSGMTFMSSISLTMVCISKSEISSEDENDNGCRWVVVVHVVVVGNDVVVVDVVSSSTCSK